MVSRKSYELSSSFGDLSHEVGHVLGLFHTHLYSNWNWSCLTEPISRTRTWPALNICPRRVLSNYISEATGDDLRDTQADDNLIGNKACYYAKIFGENDPWGESYDNPPNAADKADLRNIMSYNSATNCVDKFSRLQIAGMLRTIKWKKFDAYENGWLDPKFTFDSFEPDYDAQMARQISVGETQEHNFHQQYNFTSTTQCEVDWVRYTPAQSGSTTISTSAITGRTAANTRLTLFNNAQVQLDQNDDISATNQFSVINANLQGGQTYFIRVENMASGVTGYYNLRVRAGADLSGLQISGDGSVCTQSPYNIPNLPAGTAVTWSVEPQGLVTLSNTTGPQTTLTRVADGIITLNATLLSCGVPLTLTKQNITVGKPRVQGWYNSPTNPAQPMQPSVRFQNYYNEVCYSRYIHTNMQISPGSTVTWYGDPSVSWWQSTGGNLHFYFSQPGQEAVFTLQATNSCGTTSLNYKFVSVACGGGGGGVLLMAPNPANGNTTVSLKDKDEKEKEIKEIRIVDKSGVELKRIQYSAGVKKPVLDLSFLRPDIYTVLAWDGESWSAAKLSKQ